MSRLLARKFEQQQQQQHQQGQSDSVQLSMEWEPVFKLLLPVDMKGLGWLQSLCKKNLHPSLLLHSPSDVSFVHVELLHSYKTKLWMLLYSWQLAGVLSHTTVTLSRCDELKLELQRSTLTQAVHGSSHFFFFPQMCAEKRFLNVKMKAHKPEVSS